MQDGGARLSIGVPQGSVPSGGRRTNRNTRSPTSSARGDTLRRVHDDLQLSRRAVESMDRQEAAGGSSPHGEKTVERDGVRWPLARQEDLAWLSDQTDVGLAITSAILPIYEAYGTVVAQEEDNDEYEDNDDEDNAAIDAQERQLVKILQRYGSTSWWLGFIEGGEDEQLKPLFPHTKRIRLYVGWPYVVVLAGPAEALRWGPFLPDLIVPADHSWCPSDTLGRQLGMHRRSRCTHP